ncbi:uncharacterized protein LOC143284961 [Babylonia areolata]|uniref:uncharacterized protein LOC143284961 n=1 Tax=Babylonia areolata TaxID=304850 RepID=UPI003FD12E78
MPKKFKEPTRGQISSRHYVDNPPHAATSSPRLLSEEKEEGKETEEKTPLSDPSEERRGPSAAAVGVGMGMEGEEFDEDFPAFLMVRKTNRLEERDHWKWQVTSLLAVTMAWAVLWLPSHLFVFADKLGLGWNLPDGARIAAVVVGYTHAALMPLLWLLHKPIRAAVLAFIFCRCCQDDDDDEVFDDSIEFQDVGPYRQAGVPVGVPARPDAAAGVSGSASAPPPPHDPAGTAAAQGSA